MPKGGGPETNSYLKAFVRAGEDSGGGARPMGMTPDTYLGSFVVGNLEDCIKEEGDLRRAFNAAVSASHLADNYYTYNLRYHPERVSSFPALGDFVQHLSDETGGAFRDLRSIANVYKHLYVEPRHLAHATVLSGGALGTVRSDDPEEEIQEVDADYEEGTDSLSGRLFVRFTRKDGSTAEFLPVLKRFIDYWQENYLYEDV